MKNKTNRLEELFNESRPIPLTHNVVVDEDRMLDLIDQMRVTIPEEVKRAQQILTQRDRILAQAQEEANRIAEMFVNSDRPSVWCNAAHGNHKVLRQLGN